MKWMDWLVAFVLVAIGICCLTMSATSMLHPGSFQSYMAAFLQICMWIGIPALIGGTLYLILKSRKGS
ncbi:hypothetical protein WMW72_21935 [Paenibacillus filicis]|uniref:Uncharacterized protein n=1 Tax=Paenibacillus filicis TaxID=669464 RepID=A0ABU9DNX6_9BACL